jgi:hypothetical protein
MNPGFRLLHRYSGEIGMSRIASSIVLLAVGSTPVWAIDLPAIKPGLWQSATTVDGAAPVMATLCIDGSVQKEMFAMTQE